MADVATTTSTTTGTTTDAATTTSPTTAKPWFEGKADAETIGHWDNKGWKKDDPVTIALEATKQARELQKHFGVPADQLIRLPKDATDEAGWKQVYNRLGVPAEAKDYDLSTITRKDGSALDTALAERMRTAMLNAAVPKDKAPAVVKAVIEHLDSTDAARATDAKARHDAAVAKLKADWGPNERLNELHALEGTKRLGVTQDQYDKIKAAVGVDVAAEMFRKIGAGTTEDTFVDGGKGGPNPTTRAGAIARKAELEADPAFVKAYLSKDGGAKEKQEMRNLMLQIHGDQ